MAKGWSFGALVKALKGAAFLDIGTVANSVAAGNDSRIVGAAQKGNNLADLTDYAKARNQLSAAHIYGDTNVKFWALDSPGDSNSVVTIGRLNTVANTKANWQGDSNVDFYCRNNGDGTAAVNNQRLDFRLQSKAALNGDSNQTFYCRNSGDPTAAANNERLNYMLTSKADVAGNQYTPFNVGGATAGTQAVRLDQFQSGNNGNGAWVKLPGGLMWCRHNLSLAANASTTWTFPAQFPGSPAVFFSAFNGENLAWFNGISSSGCSIYNPQGVAININVLAMW